MRQNRLSRLAVAFRARRVAVSLWFGAAVLAACVENYSGTRVVGNMVVSPGFDRTALIVPTPGRSPGDPGYFSHYELYARIGSTGWVRLAAFHIRPAYDPTNPCQQFVPDDFCVELPEHPCNPWINPERFAPLADMLAIVSAPAAEVVDGTRFDYVPGYDYAEWPDSLFEDPQVTDAASKLARENLRQEAVQAFCEALPEGHYVGNGPQLTLPRNGRLYGIVDGSDPRTGSTVGGFSFNVSGKLERMTEMLLVRETDPSRISAENRDRRDLPPGPDSQVFLVGQRDGPFGRIERGLYRGVTSVDLESPYLLPITMHVIVYEDIDEDPITF